MKKIITLALLAVVAFALPAFAGKAKPYINGIDPNYPPFAYVDEKTGQPAGFDVDSINWIAKKMGITVEHKPMAWDGIIPALQAKQIDMIASGMSITDVRRKQVDFSNSYWKQYRVFLAKKDSTITPAEIFSKKIKLGVQRGTSEAEDIAKEKKEKGYLFELRAYDNAPLAVEDILSGRIEAALMDSLPANDALAKGRAVKIIGTQGEEDNFGVAVRKGDTKLLNILNEGYKLLMADPYWQELQKKYLNK